MAVYAIRIEPRTDRRNLYEFLYEEDTDLTYPKVTLHDGQSVRPAYGSTAHKAGKKDEMEYGTADWVSCAPDAPDIE